MRTRIFNYGKQSRANQSKYGSKLVLSSAAALGFGLLLAAFVVPSTAAYADSNVVSLTVSSGAIDPQYDSIFGRPIYGYYVTVTQNGQTQTGFTTADFNIVAGQNFQLTAADYGDCVFDHWWLGTHINRESSDNPVTVIEPYNGNINALYNCGTSGSDSSSTGREGSANSQVTIKSKDTDGNTIDGYYTILYQGGAVVNTGFTPATFDLTSGQQYTIEVQDYGSYYFNYWQDDSSTSRDRTFTASDSAQTLTAVYSTSPSASPPADDEEEQPPEQTADTISVTTTDSAGNQIYGYYTTLSQNGNTVQSAFSPAAFTVQSGQIYQVAVADYGQYVFDHWSDGSADRQHSAVAGDSLIAVYRP